VADLGALSIDLRLTGLEEELKGMRSVLSQVQAIINKDKERSNSARANSATRVKAIKDEAAEYLKAEAAKTAAAKKEQASREKMYEKMFDQQTKEAQKAADKQVSIQEKLNRELLSLDKAHNQALAMNRAKDAAAVAKQAKENAAVYQRYVGGPLGNAMRRGFQTAGMVAGGALIAYAGSKAKEAWEERKEDMSLAGQIEVASNVPGKTRVKQEDALSQATATARELGTSVSEVEKGYLGLAKGGRPDLVKTLGHDIAKVSFAENADPEKLADLVTTLARMQPKASPDQLRTSFMHVVGQAKQYGESTDDIAATVGKVTKSASLFGQTTGHPEIQATVANQLLGMTQIARAGGATSAGQAASAVDSFFNSLLKATPKKLAKAGLSQADIVDSKGQLLPPNLVVENVLSKTKGNPAKLEGLLSKSGMSLLEGVLQDYKSGGTKAVDAKLLTAERAGAGDKLISEDVAIRQKAEPIQQLENKAMTDLKESIATHMPMLTKALEAITPHTVGGVATELATGFGIATGAQVVGGVGKGLVTSGTAAKIGGGALSGIGAVGGAAGAAGGIAVLGAGAAAVGSTAAAVWQGMKLWEENTLTTEQAKKGSAAQFAPNQYDKPNSSDPLAKAIAMLVSFLKDNNNNQNNPVPFAPGTSPLAGPKGPNLPGQNK
jgi:hypothetical protein